MDNYLLLIGYEIQWLQYEREIITNSILITAVVALAQKFSV